MLQNYNVFFPNLWRINIVRLDDDITFSDLEGQLEQYLDRPRYLRSEDPILPKNILIVPDNTVVLPDEPDMDDIWNRIQSPGFLRSLKRRQTLNDVIKTPVDKDTLHLVIRVHPATQAVNICRLDTGQINVEDLPHNTRIKTLCPNGVPIEQATVYKSSTPVTVDEEPPEVTTLNKFTSRDLTKYLHDMFPWGFNPSQIHFFVDVPHEDEVPKLPEFEARRPFFDYPKKSPSSEGHPKEFAKIQRNSLIAIECGRPLTRESRIPASLFDEVLCKFQHDLQFGEPTSADKVGFQDLRKGLVDFFDDENTRKQKLHNIMRTVLGHEAPLSSALLGRDGKVLKYQTDGDIRERVDMPNLEFMLLIKEVKNELTGNTADPYLQSICYYREQHFQFWKKDETIMSNYPAILLLHFGPYIAIAVAVFTDKVRVEHLSCISLHAHSTNVQEREAGERVVYALRVAVEGLKQFYKNLRPPSVPIQPVQNFFPFRNYYTIDNDDTRHEFIYKKAEEDKRVFRAELKDAEKTQIYVKFTRRYSEAAHRAAYEAGYAPELLAVNDVYGWSMVVMRDISSEYRILWGLEGEIASKAKARAKDAMKAMHKKGFVHGDARSVNIMIRRDDSEDIKLIDWDWAGRIGEATYPHNLNNVEIRWPDGVKSFAEIKPQHDLDAIETL